jgi:hypothetical protein
MAETLILIESGAKFGMQLLMKFLFDPISMESPGSPCGVTYRKLGSSNPSSSYSP